jgi:hypothetical protein
MRVRWWKWLGLAGLVGVAATGAVIARSERQRRAYTPQEVRERLQARFAAASGRAGDPTPSATATDESTEDESTETAT